MCAFRVIRLGEFNKTFNRLNRVDQFRVERVLQQLIVQGDVVGRPLAGFSFLREKRLNGKRLYYVVYSDYRAILVVTLGGKKEQSETIDAMVRSLTSYQALIVQKLREMDSTSFSASIP